MSTKQMAVIAVLIACGTLTLIVPLLQYVTVGWRARRNDIMDGFSTDARCIYFQMFMPCEPQPSRDMASKKFDKMYTHWYGRRFFIVPGILLVVIGGAAVTAIVLTALQLVNFSTSPFFVMPEPAVAATAGAYLWVANDQISRARRLDFAPSDVLWGVLRLVIAIPMGYAFADIVKPDVGAFVAFALGAFPLTSLTSLLRRLTTKTLGAEATADETTDDIINLQGVNKVIMERLANEGVTTITQVAYCDPIRLTMRSNLPFNFIMDLMNQSLAWMYLENLLDVVRPLGMRGACEIKYLIRDLDDSGGTTPEERHAHDIAVSSLLLVATACKQAQPTLEFAFRQIAYDPFTSFLKAIWDMTDAGCPDDEGGGEEPEDSRDPPAAAAPGVGLA
jgi:hypothetical protein